MPATSSTGTAAAAICITTWSASGASCSPLKDRGAATTAANGKTFRNVCAICGEAVTDPRRAADEAFDSFIARGVAAQLAVDQQQQAQHVVSFARSPEAAIGPAAYAEVTRLIRAGATMQVVLTPLSALQIAGLLQLACRHPKLSEDLQKTAAYFLAGIRQYFAGCPAVLEVLRRGDDPAHDR